MGIGEESSRRSRRSPAIDGALGSFQPPILTAPCFILTWLSNLGRLQRSSCQPAAGKLGARRLPRSHSWRDRLGENSRAHPLSSLGRLPGFLQGRIASSQIGFLALSRERRRSDPPGLRCQPERRRITPASFPFRLPRSRPALGEERPTERPPPCLGPGARTPSSAC